MQASVMDTPYLRARARLCVTGCARMRHWLRVRVDTDSPPTYRRTLHRVRFRACVGAGWRGRGVRFGGVRAPQRARAPLRAVCARRRESESLALVGLSVIVLLRDKKIILVLNL